LDSYHGVVRKQAPFAKRFAHDIHARNAAAAANHWAGHLEEPLNPTSRKHTAVETGRIQSKRVGLGSDIGEVKPEDIGEKPPPRGSDVLNGAVSEFRTRALLTRQMS
jgi:hypothetical protein